MQEIFANASSFIRKPVTLNKLVAEIDKLDWYSARQEGLGDLYEGLLQKNAEEKKSGAGQYFTPRPLIDAMVAVMQPRLEDVIQDPAAGTGGFLIAAQRWIREHQDISELNEAQQQRFYQRTFYGMEHVQDTHRLALMNLMLHGLDSVSGEGGIRYGDTMSSDGEGLPKASLILTNPPFGTKKGGGLPSRTDFTFPTSNKQFCFLQHIYRALKPGGRAAVVLPDNVLFEGNVGKQIRDRPDGQVQPAHDPAPAHRHLLRPGREDQRAVLHPRATARRATPRTCGCTTCGPTCRPSASARRLTREHFAEFEAAFGADPLGLAPRMATGPEGRWQCFSREEIAARGDSLDLTWLKDDSTEDGANLPEPAVLAQEAMLELEGALEDLRAILAELGVEEVEELV